MSDWYTPLRLTATEHSTVTLKSQYTDLELTTIQYRRSAADDWSPYTVDTPISLNPNEYVEFQNTEQQWSSSPTQRSSFTMTGSINASGNIQSLLGYRADCYDNCFERLFANCLALRTTPDMPADVLAPNCYCAMYLNTSIERIVLPAKTLADFCYSGICIDCKKLKYVEIAATDDVFDAYGYTYTSNWLGNVHATGTLCIPANVSIPVRGASTAPSGWDIIYKEVNDATSCADKLKAALALCKATINKVYTPTYYQCTKIKQYTDDSWGVDWKLIVYDKYTKSWKELPDQIRTSLYGISSTGPQIPVGTILSTFDTDEIDIPVYEITII